MTLARLVTPAALILCAACSPAPVTRTPDGGDADTADAGALVNGPYDTIIDVPAAGPYGTHTFTLQAKTNWVNTGLFLPQGGTARIDATGQWTIGGTMMGPEGSTTLAMQRGCPAGSLAARSGLDTEGPVSCIGAGGTFTAPRDDVVYVGMIASSDLEEGYAARLRLGGELSVTVTSDGSTVPTVPASQMDAYDFASVASGRVELAGRHVLIATTTAQVAVDKATAVAAIETLDQIYEIETQLRGMTPFEGQRIRWVSDVTLQAQNGYLLAGNPIRCVPDIFGGTTRQRILRASDPGTDDWGFSHEMGHTFGFANGAWQYQSVNVESWPNIFTLRALTTLGHTSNQPNIDTYCDGKDAYLSNGTYDMLRDDPFLQLCFLTQFTDKYGWPFWETFFQGMNTQTNADVHVSLTQKDLSVWSYVRDRFSLAAGEDVTPVFNTWRVPVR